MISQLPTRTVDALVVGAGPAGIFATLAMVAAGLEVLLIDAGPDIHARTRPGPGRDGVGGQRGSYEEGVGGAGLYSDGKLCLSLDVGGHLEEYLSASARAALLQQIEGVFGALLGPYSEPPATTAQLDRAHRQAAAAELSFKYYPVLQVGTDRCARLIEDLMAIVLDGGAELRADCRLADLRVDASTGEKLVTLEAGAGRTEVRARHVVLAMGKVGAARQAELCTALGVAVAPQPIYVGARLETDTEAVAPLFRFAKDPKYSLRFPDGTKLKTHCASKDGEMLELHYDGLPLAGGHNYANVKSGRSGFSLLWDGITAADPYGVARDIMRRASARSGGHLLVQTVADYRAGRPSDAASLAGIRLTQALAAPGDIRGLFPDAYYARCDAFLEHLERLAPDLLQPAAVLYAPAIEWWMRRSQVRDVHMETAVPGLYVCGDGSGWSQGIVHAAATGLLAGQGIAGAELDVAAWARARRRPLRTVA